MKLIVLSSPECSRPESLSYTSFGISVHHPHNLEVLATKVQYLHFQKSYFSVGYPSSQFMIEMFVWRSLLGGRSAAAV